MKVLQHTVFPSPVPTIALASENDEYGGAHSYIFQNCLGFANGETQYDNSFQEICFVQKSHDGSVRPGVQSEQLVIALLDRTIKLNNLYPSPQNDKMIAALQMFLDACRERIEDRINRGVMGELKK